MGPLGAFLLTLVFGGLSLAEADGIYYCLGFLLVSSGVIALVTSDSLNKAIAVIFGQLAVLFAGFMLVRELPVQQYCGKPAVIAWGCMAVISTLNMTSFRLSVLSLLWFLLLDVSLSVASCGQTLSSEAAGSLVWGRSGAGVVTAMVGAVILLVPVVMGGLLRLTSSQPSETQGPDFS